MAYKAIIAGASGLVGGLLLDILLQRPEYDEVIVLVRKELPLTDKKLLQLPVDFDKLADYADDINGHAIFSCLGSTRAKTPDLTVYRKIDHDYPLQLAQIGAKNGIDQLHLVSSLGADEKSSNFYTKIKGETEEDIKTSGVKSIHIYRPSLITGKRKEHRAFEGVLLAMARIIDPLLFGGMKKYRSIPAQTIAMAMFNQSLTKQEGIFIYPSDKIKELA